MTTLPATFSIHSTTYFGRFRVHHRPAGDFAVDRFNRFTGKTERWGLYLTRAEADQQCGAVNTLLANREGSL